MVDKDNAPARPHVGEPVARRLCFEENLHAMVELLAGGEKRPGERRIGLELERFLIDDAGNTVPFSGEKGVAALLAQMARGHAPEEQVAVDGRLMGLAYAVDTAAGPVPVTVSLEPAAQIEVSAGPSCTVEPLYQAVRAFDAEVARALEALGLRARLVARGCNPVGSDPATLELIPKKRYADMDAYLVRRGSCARDMMRASASTQASIDYVDEPDALRVMRTVTVLGPVLAFLFDNAPVFRGAPAPRMARSLIWRNVDAERCGTVPGCLERTAAGAPVFSFERYARWVASVHPILFTDARHETYATGNRIAADLMGERPLATSELMHLFSMVFPNVRLKGFVELREMDALPPRLAAACVGLVAAAVYCPDLAARLPFDVLQADEAAVEAARDDLMARGWDARPYGAAVGEIAQMLVAAARGCARTAFDEESAALLEELWAARRLPRDLGEKELARYA